MEKLVAHREQPIPSLQEAQTTVPKQLETVFRKMVAKRIEDRYQSMSEVVAALERLGFGSSETSNLGEAATALTLSFDDRKKLASKATKKPLGSITEVVASEKTKYFFAKVVRGAFGTIIAPVLVFYLIRHLEKEDKPAASSGQQAAATVVMASNNPPSPLAGEWSVASGQGLAKPWNTPGLPAMGHSHASPAGRTADRSRQQEADGVEPGV